MLINKYNFDILNTEKFPNFKKFYKSNSFFSYFLNKYVIKLI